MLDAAGRPAANVDLLLRRQLQAGVWTRDQRAVATRQGDLLLDLDTPGLYRFEIRAEGLRPFVSDLFTINATQGANLGVVNLSAGGGVEGWVTNALTGRPLAGALVTLWPRGVAGIQRAVVSTSVAQSVTNTEGRYRIAGQAEGAFEVRFERSGFAPSTREVVLWDSVVLPLEEEILGKGVAVRGTVTNRAGKPRAGVQVRFRAGGEGSRLAVAEATTAEDGSFGGVSLAAGSYQVEVWSDRVLLSQAVTLAASKPEKSLDLKTGETAVSGVVLRHGQAVQGGLLAAEVANLATPRVGQLLLRTPEGSQEILGGAGSPRFETEVGADGSFAFDDVTPGRLLFTYQGAEERPLTRLVDVPADGESPLAIDFSGEALRGLARLRQTGEPVAEVAVELRDAEGNPLGTAITDAAGRFGFDDVTAADVVLEASKAGFRAELEKVSLASRTPVVLDLEPADTGTVSARLRGLQGSPLAYAFVTLLTEGGALVRSLPLDGLGYRQFEDVPAGRYRLAWTDPAYGLGTSEPILVQSGQDCAVEQQLQAPARLELACPAERCGQSPLEGLTLFASQGLDLASLLPGFSPGLALSAEGRLQLGALQPGNYRLVVRLGGASSAFEVHASPGQIIRLPVGPPALALSQAAGRSPRP